MKILLIHFAIAVLAFIYCCFNGVMKKAAKHIHHGGATHPIDVILGCLFWEIYLYMKMIMLIVECPLFIARRINNFFAKIYGDKE